MAQIDEAALRKQIKAREFSRVYLLYGDDAYLKHFYANEIPKKCVTALEGMNYARIDGKNLKIKELSDSLEQIPLMSEYRCVLVQDYNYESASESDKKLLKEILSDIPETSILVFWCETLDINPKKPGKWKTLMTQVEAAGDVVALMHRKESDLRKMLINSAAKKGVRLDISVANYLISVCHSDLTALKNEIEKLCAYKKDSYISKEDIDLLTPKTAQDASYKLVKAVLACNLELAVSVIGDLFYQKIRAEIILNELIECFVDIYRVKAAAACGLQPQDIAEDFGYAKNRLFVLQNASVNGRRLDVSDTREILNILDSADASIKSSSADKKVVLEKTAFQIVNVVRKAKCR
jgi:DNA polymerase-3 subunit delta